MYKKILIIFVLLILIMLALSSANAAGFPPFEDSSTHGSNTEFGSGFFNVPKIDINIDNMSEETVRIISIISKIICLLLVPLIIEVAVALFMLIPKLKNVVLINLSTNIMVQILMAAGGEAIGIRPSILFLLLFIEASFIKYILYKGIYKYRNENNRIKKFVIIVSAIIATYFLMIFS